MPPDGVERIGVEAKAEGVTAFLRDMQRMERGYDSFIGQFAKGALIGAAGSAGLNIAVAALSGNVVGLGAAFGTAAVNIGRVFVDAVKSATAAVTEFLAEGLQLAGQFQEQEFAALAIGRAMGLQEQEIRDAIDTLNDANIRYDVAAKVTSQLIRNEIDLAKAFDLARVAQGAAVIVGEDSSETLQRLVWAATTHNTVMLRKMGIMVDLTAEEEKYAVSIGKTVGALTQQERVQADVNAVIKAGASLMDVYAAAMESPTKALRSLSQRVIPELQASLMQVFLPAWKTAIVAVMRFADAIKDAVSEGGALYPVMIQLGAIASILADAFSAALQVATDFVTGLEVNLGGGLADIAAGAFGWGMEIVASFAEGIIEAASTVLVVAMNFIGGLLAWFMGSHSAPRIARGLPEWGAAAMEEYLRGFTKADFGVLEGLQSILRQALTGPGFAAVSQEIARGLAEGVDESFFERLAASTGKYGEQIAELARMEFELADATKALADANKRYEQSQEKVSSLTAEYNDLLREGAEKDILDAKLEQIKAAENERDAAAEDAAAAETNIDALKEQADLQRKLVKQLLAMAKAMEQATAAARAAAKARAAAVAGEMPGMPGMPDPADWDISSKIKEAIDEAKIVMRAKLLELFAPIIEVWNETGKPALDEISEAFLGLGEDVVEAMKKIQEFVDDPLIPTWDIFWKMTMKEGVLPVLQDLLDLFGFVYTDIVELPPPIEILITAVKLLGIAFYGLWFMLDKVHDFLIKIKDLLGMSEFRKFGSITEGYGDVMEGMLTLSTGPGDLLEGFRLLTQSEGYKDVMQHFARHSLPILAEGFGMVSDSVRTFASEVVPSLRRSLETNLRSYISDTLIPVIEELRDLLGDEDGPSVAAALVRIGSLISVDLVGDAFPSLYDFIKDYLLVIWDELIVKFEQLGEAIITIARVLLEMKRAWVSFIGEIDKSLASAAPYLGTSSAQASATSMPASSMTSSSQITYSAPVSVGPNYISGGLDAAAVEALAVRAVEKAFRRTV